MTEKIFKQFESFILSNRALVFIVFLTFILRLPSLLEPIWYLDESVYLTIGQKINRGGLLYVDIFDHKTPGIYYLAAWSLKFLGESVWSFKFLLTLWMIPTLGAFYFLAKRLFNKKTAILATLFLALSTSLTIFEGNIVNSELLMILPTALGIIFGLKSRYFISGVFFSLALLLKFPAVFDFAAFFAFVALGLNKRNVFETTRKLLRLTAGFTLPFLVTLFYFSYKGAFAEFISSIFFYNLSYTNYKNEFIIPNGLLIIKALPLVTVVLYFFWRIFSRRGKGVGKVGSLEFIIIWLVFSYYGAVFGGRPYTHYLIQALPALSLIVGYTVSSLAFRKLGVTVIAVFVILSLLLGFKPSYPSGYYSNFLKLVSNKISTEDYQNSYDQNISRTYSIASFLTGCVQTSAEGRCEKPRTNPDEKIYLWVNQPSIYFLSKRDPATRYITIFHVSGSNDAKNEVVSDLRKNEPRFIIQDQKEKPPFPELDSLIQRDYNLFAISEDFMIYELSKNLKGL